MYVDPTLAMLAGLSAGTFAGWINGMVITRAKIPPFIATLGMLGIARGMALVITGGVSHPVLSPLFLYIGNAKLLGLPIPLYFVIVTFLVIGVMMHGTVFGRHVYAIGGNEGVARLQGIPVDRQKVKIYALSGFLAGLAAVVMTGRLAATPPSVAQAIELQAIAAVIIGGVSFVGGRGIVLTALIGALIMAMITNGLNILGVSSFYQQVLIGIVIIVAVVAMTWPNLTGTFERQRLKKAGEQIQTEWSKARNRSIRTGRVHVFQHATHSDRFFTRAQSSPEHCR